MPSGLSQICSKANPLNWDNLRKPVDGFDILVLGFKLYQRILLEVFCFQELFVLHEEERPSRSFIDKFCWSFFGAQVQHILACKKAIETVFRLAQKSDEFVFRLKRYFPKKALAKVDLLPFAPNSNHGFHIP